jgi:hypothetical protein
LSSRQRSRREPWQKAAVMDVVGAHHGVNAARAHIIGARR